MGLTRKCCHGGERASEKPTSDARFFSFTSENEYLSISAVYSLTGATDHFLSTSLQPVRQELESMKTLTHLQQPAVLPHCIIILTPRPS
ncbi:hypothetical protein GZ78_13980 [Endozoicomonas numazuensis]|uniref:Uncharacterized protein n=1 Tax=Endozoicomonas numazuensis TaxID=1137799 RepID=A0A081NJD9_9GAMM|nr:hypothetical protein GZ78_13980 [Endozoicomonas numazuensis]